MLSHEMTSNSAFRPASHIPRRARLSFGPVLDYVDRGNPRGVPILFLHGYTVSWRSFAEVLPHLPQRFRAMAFSQRGHGDSDRPAAGYHPADFAADVDGFLDAIGIERAIIVGHSMGSLVALRFALGQPNRVLGLVLLGGFATLRGSPVEHELRTAVEALRDPVDVDFVRSFQQSTMARPCADAFLEMVVDESLKVPARVWRDALAGQINEDVTADLGRIEAPTLIAWGDRDGICTRSSEEALAASVPNSRFVIHHDVGHALHWDDAAGFARELSAFVDAVDFVR